MDAIEPGLREYVRSNGFPIAQTKLGFDPRDPESYHRDEVAAGYAKITSRWSDRAKYFVRRIGISPLDIVADIGCGTGLATRHALEAQVVYAVEPAIAMLSYIHHVCNLAENIVPVLGSIDALSDLNLRKANKAFSHGVLIVVDDREQFLRKIFDYLPRNGEYHFTMEEMYPKADRKSLLEEEVKFAIKVFEMKGLKARIHNNGRYSPVVDVDEISDQVGQCGGEVVGVETYEETGDTSTLASDFVKRMYFQNGDPEKRREDFTWLLDLASEHLKGKRIISWRQHIFKSVKTN